jgi:hypothetical protein
MAKKKKKPSGLKELGSVEIGPEHSNQISIGGKTLAPVTEVLVEIESGSYQVYGDYDGDDLVSLVIPIAKT